MDYAIAAVIAFGIASIALPIIFLRSWDRVFALLLVSVVWQLVAVVGRLFA